MPRTEPRERLLGLFKFGRREHLERLRQGLLYFNTLRYFAKLEASNPRCDPWEGADHVLAPGTVELSTVDRRIVIAPHQFVGHLRFNSDRTAGLHVFCMYVVLASRAEEIFDVERLGFGDSWILFHEGDRFTRRVRKAAQARGLSYRCECVDYVNESGFSGSMGPFRKRQAFARESEARIVLGPGGSGPLELDVGDLSDVTDPVRDIGELRRMIRVSRVVRPDSYPVALQRRTQD